MKKLIVLFLSLFMISTSVNAAEIPPESLPAFQEIVITDKRIGRCMLPGLYR